MSLGSVILFYLFHSALLDSELPVQVLLTLELPTLGPPNLGLPTLGLPTLGLTTLGLPVRQLPANGSPYLWLPIPKLSTLVFLT